MRILKRSQDALAIGWMRSARAHPATVSGYALINDSGELPTEATAGNDPDGNRAMSRAIPRRLYLQIIEVQGIIGTMKQEISFSDEIRHAVDASGLSRYRIAKELGISESTMSRFMNRKGGLTLKLLDRLADLLGLHITRKPPYGKKDG